VRLSLRQLEIFLAVAGAGTTAAASAAVALSQSATSAALNELERALGTRLFDRVGKRLVLNDEGRALLPQARSVVDGAASIEHRFEAPSPSGAFELVIGASTTVGDRVMPRIIASFLRDHPEARIRLNIGNTRETAAAVAAFAIDVGFIEGPAHEPQLHVVPWMTDELVVVASPRHVLARVGRGRVPIASLRQAEWLLREPGSGTREAVEQVLLPHLPHVRSRVQLGSAEAIKLAAAEGLALACLSRRAVADFVSAGRLVILNTALPPLLRAFNLIYHEQKFVSPSLGTFIRHCVDAVPGDDELAPPVPASAGRRRKRSTPSAPR